MRHLITGATSGIGRAVAERLRDRGDDLVLLVRDAGRAADFPDAELIVADLTDTGSIAGLDVAGGLDSVVHAAGTVTLGAVAELDERAWRHQIEINLIAPALLTRAVLPAVRASAGTVVFVNSTSGLSVSPAWSAYATSKFGLRALADALRAEEPSIRVTSVFPSRTATPMQAEVHRQEGRPYDPTDWIEPGTVADAIVRIIDLSRDATVPDVVIRPGRR
ncbi:MAG TPA: SDR family oxidoreductase [Marmoricola sp.]